MRPFKELHLKALIHWLHLTTVPFKQDKKNKKTKQEQCFDCLTVNLYKMLFVKNTTKIMTGTEGFEYLGHLMLSTSEMSCPCALQHLRIRELALSLHATLIGSQPQCIMAPFFPLTLSCFIITMYWGKIIICTSIQPG